MEPRPAPEISPRAKRESGGFKELGDFTVPDGGSRPSISPKKTVLVELAAQSIPRESASAAGEAPHDVIAGQQTSRLRVGPDIVEDEHSGSADPCSGSRLRSPAGRG